MQSAKQLLAMVMALTLSMLFTSSPGLSKDMQGWEKDGAYDKLYKASELDRLKCSVKKVTEVVPMNGMSPAVALIVDDGDGEEILVHVGPKWFLGDAIAVKRGDKLKIRGAWAEIDGKDVFMASKIKKGDFFELKVRLTKDGTPFWTMTPEELAREQAQQ
jgi:hypothetical protein